MKHDNRHNTRNNYNKEDRLDYFTPIKVSRGHSESFESLLKRFRKKEEDAGIIKEAKDRHYFEKESDKQRKKDRYRDRTIKKLNNKANK